MNVENENVEPVTDLGLALGYSSQCVQRRLNSDSGAGAGANAGSRIDMKFVATNPLSELVWSSRNGPSNVVLSPSQEVCAGRSSNDKPINEENFIMSQDAFYLINETAGRSISVWNPGIHVAVMPHSGAGHEDKTGIGYYLEETKGEVGVAEQINVKENFKNSKEDCLAGPSNIQVAEISETKDKFSSKFPADLRPDLALNEPLSGDPTGGGKDIASGNQTSRMEIVLASKVHHTKESEANDTLVRNLTSSGKRREKSASFLEKESKNKIARTNSVSVHPLEKLESTSENDLQNLLSKNVSGAASKVVLSESAQEVKNSSQPEEETFPRDKAVSGEHSPTTSRIRRYRRKGKEKALSDGDVNERMSKDDDDSHESVESCNSTGLFSTCKKRWSFEQQLIVGSKKVKKQIQETPGSTSCVKQDSSFMNWISNIMKGFPKSNLDESPSVDLTLAHTNYGHKCSDQKFITYKKNQDSECRNFGFQSIFQSLYRPKTKGQERISDDNYQSELEVFNGLCDISATPLACHADSANLRKQFLLSNEKFNESTSGDGAGTAAQPKISSANFGSSQENCKANSSDNKNSCNVVLVVDQGQGETDSNSSLGKHKVSSTENIDSEPPSKVKKTHDFVRGSDPLGSLWITRFAPKTSVPLSSLDSQNQSKGGGGALECSTSCHRLTPCSQKPYCSSNDLNIVEARQHFTDDAPAAVGKEIQNCAAESETSSGFNRIKGHDDQKSKCKLNPIIPSPRFQNLEAMASVFARRLDALRHITPSAVTDNAACTAITCFYCGRKGHHLRDCSEISDGELKDLMRNINSYNGAEELHCLCIRCFKLDHWAVSCPNATSRSQSLLEGCNCGPNEFQLNKRNDESKNLLYGNNCLYQATGSHTIYDRDDPQREADPKFIRKLPEVVTYRMIPNAYLIKDCNASGSGEKNFVNRHMSEVPKGIFDFIKRIRLSRTDILKCMNSHMSLAHLKGFFLRLRLGKLGEGLGGTGYYVACITGVQREISSPAVSKNSIYVNVGGINCLVESQYISNHDFLEDELMAWWSVTVKSGSKIPSEEDLIQKIKERKMLGL
ncbi:hypothetical protein AB3S75_046745 [Citrus x aurantiifolia]